jgi:hypothetical protein
LGLIYCLVDLVNHRQLIISNIWQFFQKNSQDKIILSGIAIVSLLILIQYAGWLYTGRLNFANMVYADGFNTSDDYHAYLVFPHKMLQQSSLFGITCSNLQKLENNCIKTEIFFAGFRNKIVESLGRRDSQKPFFFQTSFVAGSSKGEKLGLFYHRGFFT